MTSRFATDALRLLLLVVVTGGLIVAVYLVTQPAQPPASPPRTPAPTGTSDQRILETDIDVEILPDPGRLHGTTRLILESNTLERTRFLFFLNAQLEIDSASVEGQPATFSRKHHQLVLEVDDPVPPDNTVTVEISYRGPLDLDAVGEGRVSPNEVLLPFPTFWYPCDLASFTTVRCSVTVPEPWSVAVPGPFVETAQDSRKQITWQEPSPVLGVGLVAGRFSRTTGRYGEARCAVFRPETLTVDTGPYLDGIGAAHEFFTSQYGEDGSRSFALVLSTTARRAYHGGNSVAVMPVAEQGFGHETYLELARLVAQNWWGGAVSGRWFTDRPEASAWVVHGFAGHAAWHALRDRYGRKAYLRTMERLSLCQDASSPMNAITLQDVVADVHAARRLGEVEGPWVVAMLEDRLGEDQFLEGCKKVLAVHRHSTVSSSSIQHEFELASGADLAEFFRVWLDETGPVDYAETDLEPLDNGVRVTVRNIGTRPVIGDLRIGLVTESRMDVRSIPGDSQEGAFVFEMAEPATRVVLDPWFDVPDSARANNVWPRRTWPVDVAAASTGRIAVALVDEWSVKHPERLLVFEAGGGTYHELQPPPKKTSSFSFPRQARSGVLRAQPIRHGPFWSPSGSALAFQAGSCFRWDPDNQVVTLGKPNAWQLAGWSAPDTLLVTTTGDDRHWATVSADGSATTVAPCAKPPIPGTLRKSPASNQVAYAIDGGGIRILTFDDDLSATETELESQPANSLAWSSDGEHLVFLDKTGRLYRARIGPTLPEPLLELGYPVQTALVAANGSHVAWIDPSGSLRMAAVDNPVPHHVPVNGEVVAFDWERAQALVCLVAKPNPNTTMRYHADYELWRVPIDTLDGKPLPINLELR